MPPDTDPTTATRASRVNAPSRYRPDIDRWAIIVGISKYQHAGMNLKWAHRDAEELYQLLLTPAGGSFAAEHVQLLVDAQATTQAITRALRSFLKKPAKDDVVLIYFACHGAPDPDRDSNLYLLTHDTDPDDIAGTALPMREIDLSLRENLLAERVVVLADTCHSAGIGGGIGRRGVTAEAGVMNAYLDAMSAARGGLALLTSAEASETSQEDARWGGGHGVFTHYLLEGMRGAADGFNQPRDGKVAVGELFDYVRYQVQQATGNSQHPATGSNPFDRDLPLAITGGIDAQEHLELGRCLHELARIADEPDRYHAAARQFEEALRLSSLAGAPLPEAHWRLAQAWLAAGEGSRALEVLERLAGRAGDGLPPPALFTLALAQAVQGDTETAIAGLRQYLEQHPDDAFASWGRYCLALLQQPITPRALLIGIGKHADETKLPKLSRPANDVALVKDVLASSFGFSSEKLVVLVDEEAAWAGIASALEKLAGVTQPLDPVVVYFSGMGFSGDWLISYDGPEVRGPELHERLLAISSIAKYLIIDGDPGQQLIDLAEQTGDYALLMAAKPGQRINRLSLSDTEHGLFTHCLASILRGWTTKPADLKDVIEETREVMRQSATDQTPVLAGKSQQPVFGTSLSQLYMQMSAPEQRVYHAETLQELNRAYERFQTSQVLPYAQAHLSFGRALIAHGAMEQAIAALTTADAENAATPQVLLALGKTQIDAGQDTAAQATFQRLSALPSSFQHREIQELRDRVEELAAVQRHALVVGIDRYADDKILSLIGAANDALAMRTALTRRLGFRSENTVLLLNEEATRERMVSEFHALARKATKETSLFYFSGYTGASRTLICTDGPLSLSDFAGVAASAAHLIVIGDVGQKSAEVSADWPHLGKTSIWALGAVEMQMPVALEGEDGTQIHSSWTYGLLKVLGEHDLNRLTYRDWINAAQRIARAHSSATVVAHGVSEDILFDLVQKRMAILEGASRIELDALYRAIELLNRQISDRRQQGTVHPDGWLSLGVAYGALGDYTRALDALEAAAATLTPGKVDMERASAHDVRPDEIAPEISYHLGRILLASQRDYSRAVSELRNAIIHDPRNARAYYYLGQAIQEMVRRETLVEVESAFDAYLDFGAPLGHRRQVVKFLRQRQGSSKVRSS